MNGPPEDKDIMPFVINDINITNLAMRKVRKAWTKIIRSGPNIGRKNIIAREPYIQWVKERAQVVKIPIFFDSSIFPLVSEPEPILQDDVEKLAAKIKELEMENTQIRVQLNRAKQKNEYLEDESKEIKENLESNKKIIRDEKGKRDWVGYDLLGANSELNGRNNELD